MKMKKGLIYGSTMAILAIGLFVGVNSTLADIHIDNDNTNTATATGGSAIQSQAQSQRQTQGQSQSGSGSQSQFQASSQSQSQSQSVTGGSAVTSQESSSDIDMNGHDKNKHDYKHDKNNHDYKSDKNGKKLPATGSDMLILAGLAMFAGLVVFFGTRSAVKAK